VAGAHVPPAFWWHLKVSKGVCEVLILTLKTTSSCRRPNQESRPSLASFGLLGCSCVTAASAAAVGHIAAVASAQALPDTIFLLFFLLLSQQFRFHLSYFHEIHRVQACGPHSCYWQVNIT